jgi:hypothetical protein
LLTNFAESYALYQQCTMDDADYDSDGDVDGQDFLKWQRGLGMTLQSSNLNGDGVRDGTVNELDVQGWVGEYNLPIVMDDSVCFKLYLDPEGIIDGEITAYVDVPDPGTGVSRFGGMGSVIARHPQYRVNVLNTNVLLLPGRQRFESTISFQARNPLNPPEGPITIFGVEIHDELPEAGLVDVQTGFEFKGTNHITTFNTTTNQTQFFNESQLTDVPLAIARPLLGPDDSILAIDIDQLSSNSSYPANETPEHSLDLVSSTKYRNFGRRNTGFIVVNPPPGPTVVQSMVLRTANDAPDRDPASYALYGTNSTVVSPDNSSGMGEPWQLISAGPLNLPAARGTFSDVISFTNPQAYRSYRLVFPDLKNFRAVDSMQIGDVALFQSSDGTGQSIFSVTNDARAIQLPTSQADSPPGDGPENALDGHPGTKYLNLGKENSGFIVTLSGAPAVVTSFEITTANDAPSRDPASWMLFGTNDAIVSGNFSQGTAENWSVIDSGTLDLPDARLTAGPVAVVQNVTMTPYQSYRLVFPTAKGAAVGSGIQFADIQFFGFRAAGTPSNPVPEPSAIALIAWAIGRSAVAARRRA